MDVKTWIAKELWPWAQNMWESWGIQFLVLASFLFQIVLVIFGRRRKYMNYFFLELMIWGSYLLASYIATLALGKLTVVNVKNNEIPDYNVELKALLAPLLLMHLSFPDTMTAYSVEDNRLGIRQILNLAVTILFVIWILVRCWDISFAVSWLYIPLFIGGIMKSASTVLALKSVYDDSMSAEEIDIEEAEPVIMESMPDIIQFLPNKSSALEIILKAYYRFNCLRPHLVNWLYHPDLVAPQWMSIDDFLPKDAFTVTEVELSFMFDVLYTRAPILYTKLGLIGRFFSFLCLVSTLVGFSIIFRNAFLLDMFVTYTYALLIGSTLIELYQIALLPFSDWAIVQMCNRPKKLLVSKVLPFVVSICSKQKRWSNTMQQLNLLQYCMNGHPPMLLKVIARLSHQEVELERYWVSTQEVIPLSLKEVVISDIRKLEGKRDLLPFTKRGQWTLETYNITSDMLLYSFEIAFDKSIIIWHIATDIWLELDHEDSKYYQASKLLSNYMMYLLARRPYMLSVTTADITLDYASSMLKDFVNEKEISKQTKERLLSETIQEPDWTHYKDTLITRKWNLLEDIQNLAKVLGEIKKVDKWEYISSVWVEMLCYAAYNCQVYHHAEALRRGGELITHVWLLLAHKTNKFRSRSESLMKRAKNGESSKPLIPKKPRKSIKWLDRSCF